MRDRDGLRSKERIKYRNELKMREYLEFKVRGGSGREKGKGWNDDSSALQSYYILAGKNTNRQFTFILPELFC